MNKKSRMGLQSSLQFQIVSKLKNELDIQEYDVLELIPIIFKNARIRKQTITGVRLTKYGLTVMLKRGHA